MNRYDLALGKNPLPIDPELKQSDRYRFIHENVQSATGRLKLAASMIEPIRSDLNYNSFARRVLTVEQLPDGALPVYNKGQGITAYTVGEQAQNILAISKYNRVIVPLFEIADNLGIQLTQVKERNYDLIERVPARASQVIRNMEEELCLSLMNGLASSSDRNFITNEKTLNQDVFTGAFSALEQTDFRVAQIVMNENNYSEMLGWGREFVDEKSVVNLNDYTAEGILGGIWGATITVSRAIPNGDIYFMAEPQFVGHMPIQTDVTVLSADDPGRQMIGWSIFESVGMTMVNPSSVLRVRLENPVQTQFLDSCVVGGL